MDIKKLRTLGSTNVADKRVLVRADLNVPVQNGAVTSTTRLERLAPFVRSLVEQGARIIILSHFGRPKNGPDPALSLAPVATVFSKILSLPVAFAGDCVGSAAEQAAAALPRGGVLVLENLRFHAAEEANDPAFAKALAALGDLYVNDAFSAAHRAHASIEAITRFLPSCAGPAFVAEIAALQAALEAPARPAAAVVGGAKISTKLPILKNLAAKVDRLLVGGGMANTFLLADGHDVGRSLAEPDLVPLVQEVRAAAKARGCEVVLPQDVVAAPELKAGAPAVTVSVGRVPPESMILDIGPASTAAMSGVLANCKTLLWNGPLGAFEITPFGEGTFRLAREAARLTEGGGLVSVAGGGDTVAALDAAGVTERFTYVSTAGGAFLEWLEGRTLPGVAALTGEGAFSGTAEG